MISRYYASKDLRHSIRGVGRKRIVIGQVVEEQFNALTDK